jgi:ATP-dependent Clp protease ATP-binding subunit ClpC
MKFKLNVSKWISLATEGYDDTFARPLTSEIQHYVEDPIADEILNGSLKGDTINVTFDKTKKKLKVLNLK